MSYLPQGADDQGVALAQYRASATKLAAQAPYVVIAIEVDGKAWSQSYPTKAAMIDAFEALVDRPGKYVYIAQGENGTLWSETLSNVPATTTTITKTVTKALPWILGGAALIAVVLYMTRKGKKKAAAPRRRRTASFRRRTVTVWR